MLGLAGEVNGVRVKPTIGDLGENEGESFVVGEGSAAVTPTDDEPPEGAAFYRVVVSVP